MRHALARAVLRLAALLRRRPGGNAYGEVFAPGPSDEEGGTRERPDPGDDESPFDPTQASTRQVSPAVSSSCRSPSP
jgi:hypothetical protein